MKKDRVQGRSVVFRFRYAHKGFVKVGRRREPPEGSGSKVTNFPNYPIFVLQQQGINGISFPITSKWWLLPNVNFHDTKFKFCSLAMVHRSQGIILNCCRYCVWDVYFILGRSLRYIFIWEQFRWCSFLWPLVATLLSGFSHEGRSYRDKALFTRVMHFYENTKSEFNSITIELQFYPSGDKKQNWMIPWYKNKFKWHSLFKRGLSFRSLAIRNGSIWTGFHFRLEYRAWHSGSDVPTICSPHLWDLLRFHYSTIFHPQLMHEARSLWAGLCHRPILPTCSQFHQWPTPFAHPYP